VGSWEAVQLWAYRLARMQSMTIASSLDFLVEGEEKSDAYVNVIANVQ